MFARGNMRVYCPECENPCSDMAEACPKCGHPLTSPQLLETLHALRPLPRVMRGSLISMGRHKRVPWVSLLLFGACITIAFASWTLYLHTRNNAIPSERPLLSGSKRNTSDLRESHDEEVESMRRRLMNGELSPKGPIELWKLLHTGQLGTLLFDDQRGEFVVRRNGNQETGVAVTVLVSCWLEVMNIIDEDECLVAIRIYTSSGFADTPGTETDGEIVWLKGIDTRDYVTGLRIRDITGVYYVSGTMTYPQQSGGSRTVHRIEKLLD